MSRMEKINGCLPTICSPVFANSIKRIEAYCEKNSREVSQEFVEALTNLFDELAKKQPKKQKGKLNYLVFSPLQSGIQLGQKRIRLEAMDYRFSMDPMETAVHLDAEGIYHFFEEDIEQIKKEAIQVVPRIYEYELDLIRYEYAGYYHSVAKQWVKELLSELEPGVWLDKIETEPCVKLLFGGYQEAAELLLVWKEGCQ